MHLPPVEAKKLTAAKCVHISMTIVMIGGKYKDSDVLVEKVYQNGWKDIITKGTKHNT